jgi:hypothetical protein
MMEYVFVADEKKPESRAFENKSPALAFLSAVLFLVGITDLVSISLPEEISQYHWGSQGTFLLLLTPL